MWGFWKVLELRGIQTRCFDSGREIAKKRMRDISPKMSPGHFRTSFRHFEQKCRNNGPNNVGTILKNCRKCRKFGKCQRIVHKFWESALRFLLVPPPTSGACWTFFEKVVMVWRSYGARSYGPLSGPCLVGNAGKRMVCLHCNVCWRLAWGNANLTNAIWGTICLDNEKPGYN